MDMLMLFLGIIQLVSGVTCLFYEYKKGSNSVFFWGTIVFMFHFPHLLTSIGSAKDYDAWVYCSASIFAIAFDIIYLLTRVSISHRIRGGSVDTIRNPGFDIDNTLENRYKNYFAATIIITTGIMALFIKRVSGTIFESSWGGILHNNASGTLLYVLFTLIPFFVDAAGGILAYFLLQKKWKSLIFYLAVLAFSIIIRREKQRFLVVAIPFILVLFIKNRNIRLKSFVKYLIYVFAGYWLVLVLAFMRDGTLGDFFKNFDSDILSNYILNSIMSSSGELGVRKAYYLFINNHNSFNGFNTGADYIRMLLFWLPTSISFGIKPTDFAVTMGSAYMGVEYQTAYSMHPTIYGECFANLNWLGIFLAVFWAIFFSIIDKKIYKADSVMLKLGICSLTGVCYVMIARGSAYNGFFTIMIGMIVLKIVDSYFKYVRIGISQFKFKIKRHKA